MDFNGDLNLATLQPAPVFPELYNELWWCGGSSIGFNSTSYVAKGSTSASTTITSACQLFTLNASWNPNLKYAFEASLGLGVATSCTAKLYDVTAGSAVSASQISSSTGTFTVYRSGQFTLTPGHTYAIQVSATSSAYITDTSLIIFPTAPLISPSVSAISLANPSGNNLKESYYPLWVMSFSYSTQNTGGGQFLQKGSTSYASSITSATKLYTLSSSWSASQKFALEASIWGSSGTTTYASLWDTTSNTQLTSTQISTTASTATVIRSGSFTLTPSHSYGVVYWGGGNAYITKAHLVALA